MDTRLSQGTSSVMPRHVTALRRNFTKLRLMLAQLAGSRTWKFNVANTKATSNLYCQSLITLCPPPRHSTTCTAHSTSAHPLLHQHHPPPTGIASHVMCRCSRSFLSVQTRYYRTLAAQIIETHHNIQQQQHSPYITFTPALDPTIRCLSVGYGAVPDR
jgi:hypothetical protein